ncbi:MAG: lamin tail domain-containing protein [Bacteroidota bacterium]
MISFTRTLPILRQWLIPLSLLVFLVIFSTPVTLLGQSEGAIAFTGFNADGDDDFAFVVVEELPANTDIFFTDEEWDGTQFGTGEDDIVWNTGGTAIEPGTIIIFNDITTNGTMTVTTGSIVQGSMNLAGSSEALFAYTSSDGNTRNVDTFLAAISNNVTEYDGTNGTLTGTGLTQGTTAILLSTNIDVAEYTGARSGQTLSGYLSLLNDVGNWEEYNGSGDQSASILPFDDTAFSLLDLPTVTFANSSVTVNEAVGTTTLTVQLDESNGTAVDVDVVYKVANSTASLDDLDSYSTQTVSFTSGAQDGATQDVSITITDDSEYEGDEIAVFKLEQNTAGSIVGPSQATITIEDNDTPDIVLAEVHSDPDATTGDANGDGVADTDADEFIELVNNEYEPIDISNWSISDAISERFTFPEGTIFPARGVIVIFDDGTPTGYFGGAQIYTAGELSLNNATDDIILKNSEGTTVKSYTYTGADNDQSVVLDGTDNRSGTYVQHSSISGSVGDYSPGVTATGGLYNEDLHVNGTSGWRMLSAPVADWELTNLDDDIPLQGIGNSDDLNIYTSYNGSSFVGPSSINDQLNSGEGFIVYVFNNDIGGSSQLPVQVDIGSGTEPGSDVSVSLHSNGDLWNLVGNPYKSPIDVTAITTTGGTLASGVGQIWDNESSSYITTTTNGDKVLPWQGVFVQNTDATSLTIPTSAKTTGNDARLYKEKSEQAYIHFTLSADESNEGKQISDRSTVLYFSDEATHEWDIMDAQKLSPLSSEYVLMNLKGTRDGEVISKAQESRPMQLDGAVRIPVEFQTTLDKGQLTLTWEFNGVIPDNWTVVLHDYLSGTEYDLKANQSITVPVEAAVQNEQKTKGQATPGTNVSWSSSDDSGFEIVISPDAITNIDKPTVEDPEGIKLLPNYPNPFNPTTQISYYLPQQSRVKLAVYNVVGQMVAELENGVVGAGEHSVSWTATDIPSGIYIYQLEVGAEVFTRKMTLIK